MDSCTHLIAGAGITGLAFANCLPKGDYILIERDREPGGYCKTIKQDGFVWDYSGHFFHFRNPQIEQMLRSRMPAGSLKSVSRRAFIYYHGQLVEYPFQKNIHQLPHEEFIECLHDLYFRVEPASRQPGSFKEMVYARFGRAIAEKFLLPYNEKLYACDLDSLDSEAMGRFFPYADLPSIIRNMRVPDNSSYNTTFTYPAEGAAEYVRALEKGLRPGALRLNEALLRVDLQHRIAYTSHRQYSFQYLISSLPLDALLGLLGETLAAGDLKANKVIVLNLGFDSKGWRDVHWVYFPDKRHPFYRVGFYDNIIDSERMSLYVELAAPREAKLDMQALLKTALEHLRECGVVQNQRLIAHQAVVMDPAYVHISARTRNQVSYWRKVLAAHGVYTLGRYGGWTYCSIEDNILEARELAGVFAASARWSSY